MVCGGSGGGLGGVTIDSLIEFNPSRKLAKGTIAPYLEMSAISNTTFCPCGWYDRKFSSGSSGRQRVNTDHLKNFEVRLPSQKAVNDFNTVADSIVPKLNLNFSQIRTLEKLRDTLLPRLMSSEVRLAL